MDILIGLLIATVIALGVVCVGLLLVVMVRLITAWLGEIGR